VNAFHRHVVDLHLETSGNLETTLPHASLTFLAHEEALEMVHHRLVQHILTLLRPSHRRHLSVAVSVVVVEGVTSSSVVVVVAGGTSMTVTCSEEIVHPQCHDGREIHVRSLARPVNQKGGTRDASTGETKSADPNGLTESVMSTDREEIHHSLVSKTAHPMIRLRAAPRIRLQHHM